MAGVLIIRRAEKVRRETSPDGTSRLSFRNGGGIIQTLFGAVLLAVALFCLGTFLYLLPAFFRDFWRNQWFVMPLVCLIFLGNIAMFGAAGVWSVFGRNGVVFDRVAGTVTIWSSLAGRKQSRTEALAGYDGVSAACTGGSFRTGPTYSIFLSGSYREKREVWSLQTSREKAERLAGEVADFLGFSLVTTRGGTPD